MAPGLRERKKLATRKLIADTADRLFSEHGFDEVTLEQVADECVLSVKTVLRYFPTKEILALARIHTALEDFREGLASRETDVLTYWRAHVEGVLLSIVGREDWFRSWEAMIQAHSGLEAHAVSARRRYADILAHELAIETGDNGLAPRLLAESLLATTNAVMRYWYDNNGDEWDPDMYLAVNDFVMEMWMQRYPEWEAKRHQVAATGKGPGERKASPSRSRRSKAASAAGSLV